MSRLHEIFAARRAAGRGVLVAYLTSGDPDLEGTEAFVDEAVRAGVDVVELGVPFSDPVADGPTIQAASQRALDRGVRLRDVLDLAGRISARHPQLGLVLMGYANPFYRYGPEAAARDSAAAGVHGWIVPDVPTEECALFRDPLRAHGLDWIPLVAPTTSAERAAWIVGETTPPFVYYVSVTGVTGARSGFPDGWSAPLDAMRGVASAPFVVGFGISSGPLAAEAAAHAEGVVVGSALIDRIAAAGAAAPAQVESFLRELREAI
jgi:tryptophan synthase alpha chain